jgi:transposase
LHFALHIRCVRRWAQSLRRPGSTISRPTARSHARRVALTPEGEKTFSAGQLLRRQRSRSQTRGDSVFERGVARSDDRKVLNGIDWRLRTGSPRADIPERYGPATTGCNRFVRWAKIGVWERIFEAISKGYDGDLQMIDSSSIRVRQHGANGKNRGSEETPSPAGDVVGSRCMGRSRGGPTTTIHALVDANGLLILLKLTPGEAHDWRSAADRLDGLAVSIDRLRFEIWKLAYLIFTVTVRPRQFAFSH